MTNKISDIIRQRLDKDKVRYFAGDNISGYITSKEKDLLVDEVTEQFEGVLQSLVIDTKRDPNSKETARRLAKMYVLELLSGRYNPAPKVTAFPNTEDEQSTRFSGLLNVRAEIVSMCSHHHQPVKGVCFIGIIPSTNVIGLSKYIRIAQWCARRGTLQEELANVILHEIKKHTKSEDVGVYIQATHGCVEHRGVQSHNSMTQTTVLSGQFFNPAIKEEWYKQIMVSLQNSR